jgi:LDH2 family malate/lactate/ureidoglycolate dehydrogenase
MAEARYHVEPLTRFAGDLLAAAGLASEQAQTLARLLVLTDMLGRHTHGVALCPLHVEQLDKGRAPGSAAGSNRVRERTVIVIFNVHQWRHR